jgi:cyclopropane fatty-acyl-phospholipid synthase-like methyltransferase
LNLPAMSADCLYDELDPLYRAIWGRSLHHGLWWNGSEDIPQALRNLTELVSSLLPLEGTIADIGCGYGTLARTMVRHPRIRILANTASSTQAALIPNHPALEVWEGDWLAQSLAPESLDAAVAVESLSYFPSFEEFLHHTKPALKPGARLVISDWFSDTGTSPLLRYLAKAGHLPPWRSFTSLVSAAKGIGLTRVSSRDLSQQAALTWSRLLGRSLALPFRQPRLIPQLLLQAWKRPSLLSAFPLLRLAYHCGELRYHLVAFQK